MATLFREVKYISLPPSIDYNAMESRQSDARNKIIAPVFKRMGIIDQWGNGLKLIADELKDYPNIELRWKEIGLSFQLQFVKLDYVEEHAETTQKLPRNYPETTQDDIDWEQVGTKSGLSREQVSLVLSHYEIAQDTKSLMKKMGLSNRTKFKNKYINPLIDEGLLEMTIPDKPNSSLQKYLITELGKQLKGKL
jgi:hypothetical protein